MRTTLRIPRDLIEETRRLLVLAREKLIRRRRIEELKRLIGSIELEIDLPRSRRRMASEE